MSDADSMARFLCPSCKTGLDVTDGERIRCVNCAWHGAVYRYSPLDLNIDAGQQALTEDATCAHHPTKRADTTCEGTGDYICALCAIEHDGSVYSAEYLNGAGAKLIAKGFDRRLDRPDSTVVLYMGLCFVPYVNLFWVIGWPIWAVMGWIKLFKARRLVSEDVLFARLVKPSRIIVIGILLTIFTVLLFVSTLYFLFAMSDFWNESVMAE